MKPSRRAIAASVLLSALALPAAALADPGSAGAGASSDPLGDLQRTLTIALTGAAVAAITALGKRLWSFVGHAAAVKKLGLDQALADAAIHYVDQMEHVADRVLTQSEIEKHVKDYLATHGVAGDAVAELQKVIESRLGARRAMDVATARVANAAKNFNEALTTGQLARDVATLERQQDAARAAEKLPPAPPVGIVKP